MAEGAPPGPVPHREAQVLQPPQQPPQQPLQPQPGQQVHMNWSRFKPEYSG